MKFNLFTFKVTEDLLLFYFYSFCYVVYIPYSLAFLSFISSSCFVHFFNSESFKLPSHFLLGIFKSNFLCGYYEDYIYFPKGITLYYSLPLIMYKNSAPVLLHPQPLSVTDVTIIASYAVSKKQTHNQIFMH